MSTIDELGDRFVDAVAASDPVDATMVGIDGHDHEMTDYSPEGFAARAALARETLAEIARIGLDTENHRVSAEAMTERLSSQAERNEAGVDIDLNVIDSPMQNIRMVFDLMPVDTPEHWRAIASRLQQVPDALRGYAESLRARAAAGRPQRRRQLEGCLEQARSWLPADNDVFGKLIAPALDRPDLDEGLRRELTTGVEAAVRGAAEFGDFLAEQLPTGLETDAAGREEYALGSRYFLGDDINLEETYAWGWEELHRIETEMLSVARQLVPGGSIQDAKEHLNNDPARRISDPEAFRDWMQAQSDRAIAELADTHFDIPEPIRTLECRLAPTSDGAIYYTGPSEDFSRPGRMWWSIPPGVEHLTTWTELTTVYHEGVPGHHLQIAQTAYRKDTLNRWRRMLAGTSGHIEGWALYAEGLMDELGYLSEPGVKLGMLDSQAFRACRVVLDIGMHLELPIPPNADNWRVGETWNPDLGLEFLLKHVSMDEAFLRFERDRYLGWPGQAAAYKIGQRIWLQAREDARARKGSEFDLKAFHRAALDLGSMGLAPFRQAMSRL